MNTSEYKGFTLQHGVANSSDRIFVLGEGFNPEGYATLNNAKGAITKHINAIQKEVRCDPEWGEKMYESLEDIANAQVAKAATSDDKARTSVPVSASESRIRAFTKALSEGVGSFTAKINDKGQPIHSDPVMAKIYAELDYFGMAKTRDNRSRNQREGKYAGKIHGLHVRSRDKRFNGPSATNAGTVALYK